MMYPQKTQIARTFINVFDDDAVQKYMTHSHYRLKNIWIGTVTQLSELVRYFNPMSHITVIQRQNFKELCLCQLDYCRAHTYNERILEYFRLLEAFFDIHSVSPTEKLRNMINRLEVKIINSPDLLNIDKSEAANFLKMAMLFGDKNLIYDQPTKKSLDKLCAYVA